MSGITSSRLGIVGLVVLALLGLCALAAPVIAPHDPVAVNLTQRLKPPVWQGGNATYPLGTDILGRDVLSRILWGARASMALAVVAATVALAYGVILGLLAGYFGGLFGDVVMRLADSQHAFPFLVIAIAIIAATGASYRTLLITLSLWGWVVYARVVRADVLVVREKEYIQAARLIGADTLTLLFRHILPNVLSPVVVVWTISVGQLILVESGLSFLGLGIQPPNPSWGGMIAEGRAHVANAYWLTAFPGLAIMLSVLAINLIGDAIRDANDPRYAK